MHLFIFRGSRSCGNAVLLTKLLFYWKNISGPACKKKFTVVSLQALERNILQIRGVHSTVNEFVTVVGDCSGLLECQECEPAVEKKKESAGPH